jgi:integrase
MSVFKLFCGKRITSKHPKYAEAKWWVYRRIKGHKPLHRSIPEARTKEQAEQAERAMVEAVFNKKYGKADKTTFVDFGRGRYTRYCDQQNANIGAKRLYVETLCEAFRNKTLDEITPQDCRDVQAKLRKGTISDSSVNRIMSTASRMFTLACEEGILDRNPMQYVKALKEPPPRKRLLTNEEKEKLWQELEKDQLLCRLVTLAVNVPLRRGQILAITPAAIDPQYGFLSAVASKGRSSRLIPLNNTATSTLRMMVSDGQLPFPLKDFRKRWHKALIAAGINKPDGTREENFHFHDLRKEFASELIRRNVNPNIVQKLFAHSDMSITNIYMDADAEMLFDAVKRLDDVQQTEGIQ